MTYPTVRETRRADELKPGDWITAGPYTGEIEGTDDAEVLHAHPYGSAVAVTIQEVSVSEPILIHLHADAELTLLTAEEIADHHAEADRSKRIADIRALADWLEKNPWAPTPYGGFYAYVDGTPSSDHGPEGMAEMRRIAEKLGAELEMRDSQTTVARRFGEVEYEVRCFHRPKPDPSGLDYYSRPADDPQPTAGRIEPHTGAMTDGGLVDESDDDHGEAGFAFGQHDDKPLHYDGGDGVMVCGLSWQALPAGEGTTAAWDRVTCEACRKVRF